MANRNWENPYDVAELAREDGAEGLMRLADYFETTGEAIPNTVKTALLTSRKPGVFPIQGIFPSKSPVARTPVEGVPEALRPTSPFMEAETKRRASTFQLLEPEILESAKTFGISPEEMRRDLAAGRANTFQLTDPEVQESAKTFGISPEEMRRDLAQARGNLNKSVSPASQAVRTAAAVQESKGPKSVAPHSSAFLFQSPSYTLEDAPPQIQDYPRPAVVPSYTLEEAPTPIAPVPTKAANIAVAIPTASSTGAKAIPPTAPGIAKPPPVEAGSGGDDELGRLSMGQALVRALEGSGSVISGQNLRSGAADTLGERMKQIEALRAKREEQGITDTRERANNRAQVEYLMKRFPERRDALAGLLDMTKSPNFPQMLRVEEQVALDRAKKQDIGAKAEDRAVTQEYRAGTLDLKRDIAKDNRDYRAVQAGLQKAALDLRRAENEREATDSAEPTEKERSAFQTSMKPAEQTAVALKDADNLNSLSTGMLVSGKPPLFLSQSDILSFVGVPPFEGVMRSRLAMSNPQAFDLLTQMARLKTMVGHEYFGSALSPAEAERQRQFLDFGVTDTPESIARKMKSYHDSLADKASVFLRPRVLGRSLGNEWAQSTGLDAISGEGGTFAGLLDAPKGAAPKAAEVKEPAAVEGKVRMLSPDNRVAKIPAAEVEARKVQGWKEAP